MLTAKDKEDIGIEFSKNYISASVLAKRYGVSRTYIYRVLKQVGVDTTKRKYEVVCGACGEIVLKPRCQIRISNSHFCSKKCYWDWLNRSRDNYVQNRHGQRIARKIVSRYHVFVGQEVVHHIDRNTKNNTLSNLMVFRNQGEHVQYHRGIDVKPVWSGADVIERRHNKL